MDREESIAVLRPDTGEFWQTEPFLLRRNRMQERLVCDIITPVPTTLEWRRIEAMFKAFGARTIEGRGSRVRFELSDVVATFHRPHPQKEAKPYQVRDARRFLQQAGVTP